MSILIFDFANERADSWAWKVVEDGRVIAASDVPLPYYLSALADARAHGHDHEPGFAARNAKNEPDEPVGITSIPETWSTKP